MKQGRQFDHRSGAFDHTELASDVKFALIGLTLFPSKKKSTTFCRGEVLSTPPHLTRALIELEKNLKTVLESSQKMREAI